MVLDYSAPGKVKFSLTDYIKMMLDNLPDEMNGEAATPAAAHLFETNGTGSTLLDDEEQADMFHDNVAKLLFLCKQRRTRPNIQTAVAFLCTQAHHVKGPDTDDYQYKRLARVMKHLRSTIHMPLTLEADYMQIIKWWIDASFAVYSDMKSHTGLP